MPHFICPQCAWRGTRTSRTQGILDSRPAGCEKCGFGFLFELMDDYYPAPDASIIVCDQDGRILALGKGTEAFTQHREADLMGTDIAEALELEMQDEKDLPGKKDKPPHEFALEWGVRVQQVPMYMKEADGDQIPVVADFFPALDEDGGLLVVLTPDR